MRLKAYAVVAVVVLVVVLVNSEFLLKTLLRANPHVIPRRRAEHMRPRAFWAQVNSPVR